MADIKHRQEKIQDKRKKTSFRDFVREIASRYPFVLGKNNGLVSSYPQTNRIGTIIKQIDFEKIRETLLFQGKSLTDTPFLEQYDALQRSVPMPALIHFTDNENADYGHCVMNSKNVYL